MRSRILQVVVVLTVLGMAFFGVRRFREKSAASPQHSSLVEPKRQGISSSEPVEGNAPSKSIPLTSEANESVMSTILKELDPKKRREGLKALATRLAATDPVRAWSLLSSITGLADRQAYSENVIAEWAKKSPQDAIAAASAIPPGELQAVCFAAAMGEWAKTSPDKAVEFAATQLSGSGRQMAIASAAAEWARSDVNSAAKWALANSQSSSGVQAIGEIMEFWGDTDPKTGADWASKLPEGNFKSTAMEAVLLKWTDQFPEEAVDWLKGRPENATMTSVVAAAWAKSDPASAASWAQSLPAGATRDAALHETVAAWSAASPRQVLDWVEKTKGAEGQSLAQEALRTWGADDPAAAYKWAAARPDSEPFTTAVLQTWAETNSDGFVQWAVSVPEASRSDSMRSLLATSLGESSPQEALRHAAAIQDPTLRLESQERVVGAWMESDPAAAAAWKSKNLPGLER